jgi:hypothetical protein
MSRSVGFPAPDAPIGGVLAELECHNAKPFPSGFACQIGTVPATIALNGDKPNSAGWCSPLTIFRYRVRSEIVFAFLYKSRRVGHASILRFSYLVHSKVRIT